MKSIEMQSLMSLILPPEGEDELAAYLTSAIKALNAGSDAGLGRCIGVRPSTIANWKRRGIVAHDYVAWFGTTLVEKIGSYSRDRFPLCSLKARHAVINLIVNSTGNPLSAKRDGGQLTAIALPGLMALAQFLEERIEATNGAEDCGIDEIVSALDAAMFQFRHSDHFRAYL